MIGDPLTAVLYSGVSHGTLTLNSNGGFTYTPTAGYVGSDGFQYRAYDGTSYSAAKTVTLTVTNAWRAQTNGEDRLSETADDFGAVGVVSYTGDTQAFASVGNGQMLVYSSNSDSRPIIAVEADITGTAPTSLETVLTFNSVAGSTVYYNVTGISGTTRLRFATQVDASSLATNFAGASGSVHAAPVTAVSSSRC